MTELVVGLLKVDKHNFGPDSSNRAQEFATTVTQANAALKKHATGKTIRMLVAPEYYWSGYGEIGKFHKQTGALAMDRSGKHDIYKELKTISNQAGSLVLVAGSIFYKKPNGSSASAYNVCPVLQNGKFILKAYKDYDDGYASKNPGTLVQTAKSSDPYFKVGTVRFGIEVCGEHGRLSKWNAKANKSIDVQIMVSDSSFLQKPFVVATSYLVQCDIGGTAVGTAVYKADAKTVGNEIDAKDSIVPDEICDPQVNGTTVAIYKLTI